MKGQVFETLGFVIIAIAIIGVIVMLRTTGVGGFFNTLLSIVERGEHEGVSAGVNALFFMTEQKSGKSIQELMGTAAFVGNNSINLGPVIGYVDVSKEIEWRLDAMLGKGHWYMKVPYPPIEPDIQIVFVVDTSTSLCDDVQNMEKALPIVIQDLKLAGKKVMATIYLMAGGSPCCDYTIACDKFPASPELQCTSIVAANCPNLGSYGQTEEDWGHGIACTAESGPQGGWKPGSVRIAIPVSDELPEGSECHGGNYCCPDINQYTEERKSLDAGINAALNHSIKVFPFKGEPCGTICLKGMGTAFTQLQCDCSNFVTQYMTEIASKTGGEMYQLNDSTQMIEALKDAIRKSIPTRTQQLEAGSKIGYEQRALEVQAGSKTAMRAVEVPIPVAIIGKYTTAYVYQWS